MSTTQTNSPHAGVRWPRRVGSRGPTSPRFRARCGRRRPAIATKSASSASAGRRPAPPAAGASSICRHGVHVRPDGYRPVLRPFDYRCIGPACAETGDYCIDSCPQRRALAGRKPGLRDAGRLPLDARSAGEHLDHGRDGQRPRTASGAAKSARSGGGFDRLRFRFPAQPPAGLRREDISTKLLLNRRNDAGRRSPSTCPGTAAACRSARPTSALCWARPERPRRSTPSPARARADIPERFLPYKDHVITQVATGLVRRPRGDDPAGADRRVQVRPGGQAGSGRPPAGRQEHAQRGRHARNGRRRVALLALPLPQRLFGRRPQEAPRLDRARQSAGAVVGQGLHAGRRGHGGGGHLLRGRAHRPPRRQLRRHRRGAEHRQEEHRHADRVRHRPRPPVPAWPRASATR